MGERGGTSSRRRRVYAIYRSINTTLTFGSAAVLNHKVLLLFAGKMRDSARSSGIIANTRIYTYVPAICADGVLKRNINHSGRFLDNPAAEAGRYTSARVCGRARQQMRVQ